MEKLIIEDFYENLGMNKHDLFLMAVEKKENFVPLFFFCVQK